ncbi:MAG: 50S ribosomal protein L34e [Candidatus Diapherotrites archaeon]|nr:50S ribosomal protein L34e [Candidatus Diapherotrites archaeon]
MVAPFKRRLKRVKVRTPGGRVVFHFRREKPGKHVCALCGRPLHGVPHGRRPVEVRKLSKTERRPERIFGGVLCADCARRVIEIAFYVKTGAKDMSTVDIKMRPYVEAVLKRMVLA